MAVLEQVMQLKQQGVSEPDIVQYLKDQGILPNEINDALAQSKIKSELNREAVYNQEGFQASRSFQIPGEGYTQTPVFPEYQMKPSISNEPSQQPPAYPEAGQYPESYQQPVQETPQQSYQNYYPEYQQTDIETMNEIAEQLIEEKNEKIQKQISALTAFREETSAEIERINQRLEKIENNFNNLQASIIRKIGEYGEDIKSIAKEMHATQDSFSKMLNPTMDNARGIQEEEVTETPAKSRRTKKSGQFSDSRRSEPATNFEDYLRQ